MLNIGLIFVTLVIGTYSSCYALQDFPTVEPATQKSRDDARITILQNELHSEEQEKSKDIANFTEATKNNESADKIEYIKKSLANHDSNIAELKKEISGNSLPNNSSAPILVKAHNKKLDTQSSVPYWDVYHRKQPAVSNMADIKK